MHTEQPDNNYAAFLLRLWREEEDGSWRVSVYDPHSGERHNFASIRQFLRFLEGRTGETLSHLTEIQVYQKGD